MDIGVKMFMIKKFLSKMFDANIYILILFTFFILGCKSDQETNVHSPFENENDLDSSGSDSSGENVDETRSLLQISLAGSSNVEISQFLLSYFRAKDSDSGPRVAEIIVQLSDNVSLVSSSVGEAVKAAGKELVVQELGDRHQVRLVVVAMDNVNELDSGTLATLEFKKSDELSATARILTDSPIFAPEAANEGLLVSDPITF